MWFLLQAGPVFLGMLIANGDERYCEKFMYVIFSIIDLLLRILSYLVSISSICLCSSKMFFFFLLGLIVNLYYTFTWGSVSFLIVNQVILANALVKKLLLLEGKTLIK